MSYILDALRRADAERQRGGVPGIHAQQLPLGGPPETAHAPASRKLLWVSLGLTLLLLVTLAWQWLGRDSDSAASMETSRAAQGNVTPPPPVPGPAAATTTPPIPNAAAAIETPPLSATTPTAQAKSAALSTPASAAAAALPRKPPAAAAATRTTAPKPPTAAASNTTTASRVMARSELPDEVQRGLPTLTVGGASYSQNPVNRMLIVNGQIFREGDLLAPDVALEQIRLKEAVIATKGYRYRIDY